MAKDRAYTTLTKIRCRVPTEEKNMAEEKLFESPLKGRAAAFWSEVGTRKSRIYKHTEYLNGLFSVTNYVLTMNR